MQLQRQLQSYTKLQPHIGRTMFRRAPLQRHKENLSIAMFVHMVEIILSLCLKSAQTISISVLTQSKIRETVQESWKKDAQQRTIVSRNGGKNLRIKRFARNYTNWAMPRVGRI